MADSGAKAPDKLNVMAAAALAEKGLPPVHLWNPKFCGDLDLEIRKDGSWWHEGARIGRDPLVRLFARILRKDDDGETYLVTPHEKARIRIEKAPFVATRVDREGEGRDQTLIFYTNVGDLAAAGPERPIRVETDPGTLEPEPYVLVRGRLEALMARPVFYELVAMSEERETEDGFVLGLWSGGAFFALGPAGVHQC